MRSGGGPSPHTRSQRASSPSPGEWRWLQSCSSEHLEDLCVSLVSGKIGFIVLLLSKPFEKAAFSSRFSRAACVSYLLSSMFHGGRQRHCRSDFTWVAFTLLSTLTPCPTQCTYLLFCQETFIPLCRAAPCVAASSCVRACVCVCVWSAPSSVTSFSSLVPLHVVFVWLNGSTELVNWRGTVRMLFKSLRKGFSEHCVDS
jgi:hypothetical protein